MSADVVADDRVLFLFADYVGDGIQGEEGEEAIVVIDAAEWRAGGGWNSDDPFEPLAQGFGLDRLTECEYGTFSGGPIAPVVAALRLDPRFAEDRAVLV